MAAAGLWTTPKDLAQFIVYIQTALKEEKTKPLSPYYVKEMISRQKISDKEIDSGLGLFLENEGKDLAFGHGGQDEGFIARLFGFAFRGQGAVIMINNDSGWILMEEILNSIADTYRWPHFELIEKKTISVDPSGLALFEGHYVKGEDQLEINLVDKNLFIDFKNGLPPIQLYASSKCKFFTLFDNLMIDFLNCETRPDSLEFTNANGIKATYHKK